MKCPNCGFTNEDRASVCISCGANFFEFSRSSEKLNAAKSAWVDQEVIEAIFVDVEKEKAIKNKQLAKLKNQVKVLLISGSVLILLAASIAFLYSEDIKKKRTIAAQNFADALVCLEQGDFDCSLDKLGTSSDLGYNEQKVIKLSEKIFEAQAGEAFIDGDYALAVISAKSCIERANDNLFCRELICDSKIEISKRLIDAGEWRQSIDMLDEAILDCKDPSIAQDYENSVYRRWIEEENARNHFLQASMIKREWKARYPNPK